MGCPMLGSPNVVFLIANGEPGKLQIRERSVAYRGGEMQRREVAAAGMTLQIRTVERKTSAGVPYFESRGSFRSARSPCTIHLVTSAKHTSAEIAELGLLSIARKYGWGL